MNTYCVKWGGEESTVVAENETDAWAKFCDGHDQAQRYPNAFKRSIELIGEESTDDEATTESSPVADLSAEEAKDAIGRMKSKSKLQAIINADSRVTVTEAAAARLAELGD